MGENMDVKGLDLNGLKQDLELINMQMRRLSKEKLEIELRIAYLEKKKEVKKEPEMQGAGG